MPIGKMLNGRMSIGMRRGGEAGRSCVRMDRAVGSASVLAIALAILSHPGPVLAFDPLPLPSDGAAADAAPGPRNDARSSQASSPTPSRSDPMPHPSTATVQLMEPRPGLFSAGQPAPRDWNALARERGITTVVNLRGSDELGDRDEASEVRAAGLAYHQIPVSGPGDIDDANAGRLWRLLSATEGPVLVHCGSGNRVGALLAIGAARDGGMATEEAIAFGRAAGLAGAEARVRQVLAEPRGD